VTEIRSEDFAHAPGYRGAPPRAEARRLARAEAEEQAARLERGERRTFERRTVVKHGFRPTCPRCSVVCAVGARCCLECGAYLYLSKEELREIRNGV
jgi:hypothetical protein